MKHWLLILLFPVLIGCNGASSGTKHWRIGYLDALEDATLEQARKGFFVALKDSGYTPETNIEVVYRNAQGDIPTLGQAADYFVSSGVDLIATNTTLSTITAVKKTSQIPICMMVSPSPELAGLRSAEGKDPSNLFGVYETLEYIDTALTLIPQLYPGKTKVGTLINQSEPQSVDALERIQAGAATLGLEIVVLPANNAAEAQLVTEQLIARGIQVFFALPDNTIFSAFETIAAACKARQIPIVTSESGLVARGANAAFGADFYQWGYDAGIEAVRFLKTGSLPPLRKLTVRKKVLRETPRSAP
jgi:putative ABC transport system substrate-binding protein